MTVYSILGWSIFFHKIKPTIISILSSQIQTKKWANDKGKLGTKADDVIYNILSMGQKITSLFLMYWNQSPKGVMFELGYELSDTISMISREFPYHRKPATIYHVLHHVSVFVCSYLANTCPREDQQEYYMAMSLLIFSATTLKLLEILDMPRVNLSLFLASRSLANMYGVSLWRKQQPIMRRVLLFYTLTTMNMYNVKWTLSTVQRL